MTRPTAHANAVALLTAALLFLSAGTTSATVITACGQEFSGSAVLNADLDCTGFGGYAVTMHGGKLLMNGHTITGGQVGIHCDAPTRIVGPGAVTGTTAMGVNGFQTIVRVKDVDLTNNAFFGIQCFKNCTIEGGTISGNGVAVRAGGNTKVAGVTITGNDLGIDADNLSTAKALVSNSTISGNNIGVRADVLAKLTDSTVSGNGRFGVIVGDQQQCERNSLAVVKRSAITGNGTNPGCGTTEACADVATCGVAPRLRVGASCDHSYVNGSGVPGDDWNVCSAD